LAVFRKKWFNSYNFSMNPLHPEVTIDTLYETLHRASWSIGDISTDRGFLVTGTNEESRIHATGKTLLEAWQVAYNLAEDLGMLQPWSKRSREEKVRWHDP
jgi:hypothetical protein